MSQSRHERIRELLMPRELVAYEAKIHAFAYAAPILAIIVGFLLTFITQLGVYDALPNALQEEWWPAIKAARDVYFGIWLMGFGLALIFQVHSRRDDILLITNQRVLDQTGIFFKHLQEIYLGKIEDVKIKRTLIGRLLHRGDIHIFGVEKDEYMHLQGVSEPEKFYSALLLTIERFGKFATGKKKN